MNSSAKIIKLLGVSLSTLLVFSCSSSQSLLKRQVIETYTNEQLVDSSLMNNNSLKDSIILQTKGNAELLRPIDDCIISVQNEVAVEVSPPVCSIDYVFTAREKVNIAACSVDFFSDSESVTINLDSISKNSKFPFAGIFTSNFGFRGGRVHNGVDISARNGAKDIFAFMDGVVRMSTYIRGFGNTIVVRHLNGLETVYAHNSKNLVVVGDIVSAGEKIAIVGSTGRSTGPHLHFEIRINGKPIDPNFIITPKVHKIKEGKVYAYRFDKTKIVISDISDRSKVIVKRYHKISSGDTLSRLSYKYGISISGLCKLNNIKSTSVLRLGQQVRVS